MTRQYELERGDSTENASSSLLSHDTSEESAVRACHFEQKVYLYNTVIFSDVTIQDIVTGISSSRLAIVVNLQSVQTLQMCKKCITTVTSRGILKQ